jgi:ABC-type Fe3+ transport system permease subunit
MGLFRRLGRWVGAVAYAIALAPMAALVLAALFDRGPGGSVRPALFPSVLAALDPFVWECARNSLVMAAAVTIAARVVGVGLARIAVGWRFVGRSTLSALVGAGMVVPPAFGALGLRCLFGTPETWPESLAWLVPWAGWVAWFWVALAAGAPVVALATASALRRVDPVWEDAARLAGAGRGRVWRQLVWPVVRPEAARALGVVFTLTLLEPGAPLVLGLRRTLGFQVAEAALDGGDGQLTRAAVLAILATALATIARKIIAWVGGTETPGFRREPLADSRARPASWSIALGFVLVMAVAAAVVWLPVVGVFARALTPAPGFSTGSAGAAVSLASFMMAVRDPLTRGYLVNSAVLGLAVVVFDLALARAIAAWAVARRWSRWVDLVADWPAAFPPLAVGVGVLALPAVLRMAADAAGFEGSRTVIDAFDLDRTPWTALVLAVGLVRLPLLARSAIDRRRGLRPSSRDAAITLGASARQARRTLPGRWLGVPFSAALLTFALAATSPVPALLLAPTADVRPLGPAVLLLIDQPGAGLPSAAALASMAMIANLTALALASPGGARAIGKSRMTDGL